jgi:RHS repeat-associated protein
MGGANPFRFSTKYQDDETDLLYYGYRYYDAGTGRWLSTDPAGKKGGANLFVFVRNTPTTSVDYLGMYVIPEGDRPHRPTSCEKFAEWHEKEKDLSWLKGLPSCPCRLACVKPFFTWGALNPDPSVWNNPSTWTFGYHPGATWSMRSKPSSSGAGQQCCYDSNAKLITHGPGAGTPDKSSPDANNWGAGGHQSVDVLPYDWALDCDGGTPGESAAKYREVRPPDNGNGCEKNP